MPPISEIRQYIPMYDSSDFLPVQQALTAHTIGNLCISGVRYGEKNVHLGGDEPAVLYVKQNGIGRSNGRVYKPTNLVIGAEEPYTVIDFTSEQ